MNFAAGGGDGLKRTVLSLTALALAALTACGRGPSGNDLTIATVNNADMVVMKSLAPAFERSNPGIHLKWVVLEENVLRQRVTTDIAAHGGQFDVVTIGNYEAPIWARRGWLKPVTPPASYDAGDLLEPVRDAVTYNNQLYALPFYGESAMTYYRTDLFAAAGLKMPDHPTYLQIADFAAKLDDRAHQIYGVCLRGKPGWGENMATVTAIVHAFGGRWFAPGWRTEIDTPPWRRAVGYYSALLKTHGPPGASSNGFNENLALFGSGHCAMWIDATVAASMLYAAGSGVTGKVGYAAMPTGDDTSAPTWLWSWNLAVPASSRRSAAALRFITWATSADYIRLVAKSRGWLAAPPGTRQSTYDSPAYRQAAPFSGFVLSAIDNALPATPSPSRPYRSAQFVGIPEYQGIGTRVGQTIAATLTGQSTVDAALKDAQSYTESAMIHWGYVRR
jgi:sorbitol/mannitol transport system substrate-binding protein